MRTYLKQLQNDLKESEDRIEEMFSLEFGDDQKTHHHLEHGPHSPIQKSLLNISHNNQDHFDNIAQDVYVSGNPKGGMLDGS